MLPVGTGILIPEPQKKTDWNHTQDNIAVREDSEMEEVETTGG